MLEDIGVADHLAVPTLRRNVNARKRIIALPTQSVC